MVADLRVSVVVCTRDRPGLLARTLPSIVTSAETAGADVIVVEQGDSAARSTGLDIQVVPDPGTGASRARNIGLSAAGEIVLFTDDDCEVAATWVSEMADQMQSRRGAIALGPVEGMSRGIEIDDSLRRFRPWLIGHSANMAVRRSAVERVGGFDERLGAGVWTRGGEDADLIVRMQTANEVVLMDVGPAVRHIDWRSGDENEALTLAYERGAGAWLGRLARRQGLAARPYLAARVGMLREESREIWRQTHRPGTTAAPAIQFVEGFIVGALTRPRTAIPPPLAPGRAP